MAPTCDEASGVSLRASISNMGIRNETVFPDPVHASTHTSLLLKNNGMVVACTGVMCVKPMACTAAKLASDSAGVMLSNVGGDGADDIVLPAKYAQLSLKCGVTQMCGAKFTRHRQPAFWALAFQVEFCAIR